MMRVAKRDGDQNALDIMKAVYSDDNLATYYAVKEKVKTAIAVAFGVDGDMLSLARPTFFSRLTGKEAKTQHDEYWHSHIDSNQYPSFDYTALVYLNNHRTGDMKF